jgi:hypothetical protein
MNTAVLEHSRTTEAQLERINAATWVEMGFGAHALVTADDNEALAVLTARFIGMEPEQGLWVVDGSDACYRGLENAKRCAVRDLKVDAGLQ